MCLALQDNDDLAQRVKHKVATVAAEYACDAALLVARGFEGRGLTTVVVSRNRAFATMTAKLNAT